MAFISDHAYMKVCAELASSLGISISSARRKVEILAIKENAKNLSEKKEVAQKLLEETKALLVDDKSINAGQFDKLLEAMADEENFMIED